MDHLAHVIGYEDFTHGHLNFILKNVKKLLGHAWTNGINVQKFN